MAFAGRGLLPLLLIALLAARPTAAATFDVDSTADDPARTACTVAANDCSLRGAITAANALSEPSTIHVPAGTYVLSATSSCTYRVVTSSPGIFTSTLSSLCLAKSITLEGAGAETTIIDGDGHTRVLFVSADAVAGVRGVTITGGTGQQAIFGGSGGGITNHGTLTLTETVVTGNTLPSGALTTVGAGIENLNKLTLEKSRVVQNLAPQHTGGGGIHNAGFYGTGGVLTIRDSTISGNVVQGHGGGLYNQAKATVIDSTISGNSASGLGGGIATLHEGGNNAAILTLVNTTISGNHAGTLGGGLYDGNVNGKTFLNNVTITDNQADGFRGGGGIYNNGSGPFLLQNTLIAGNRNAAAAPAPDCLAGDSNGNGLPITSQGHNLIQDTTRCTILGDATGNLIGVDPLLQSLGDNGGPTGTHGLDADSPAIDAGRPAPVPGGGGFGCAATDQRGTLRPRGATCDIGAFEATVDTVLHVSPARGGNAGAVTALVFGFPATAGVTAKLTRAGHADVVADPVVVGGAGILSARFDLTGADPGAWDVVVAGTSGDPATLPGGFTVEAAGAPDLWVDVIGPPFVRLNRPARYTVFFGNRGNVDAVGVPLMLSAPAGFGYRIFVAIAPPPVLVGQARDDWSGVPLTVETEVGATNTDVPLLLPILPSGYTGSFQIELVSNVSSGIFPLRIGIGLPIFTPDVDPVVVAAAGAEARSYLEENGELVVPPAIATLLAARARDQLEAVADQGRAHFMARLGASLPILSIAQLHLDLVFYGATLVAAEESMLRFPIMSRVFAALVAALTPADSAAQGAHLPLDDTCKGGVLSEGDSCAPISKIYPPGIPPPPGCNFKDPTTFKNCQPTEAHCNAIGTHHVVGAGKDKACVPDKPPKGCAIFDNPILGTGNSDCKSWPIKPRGSFDPNDKAGSLGASDRHVLATSAQPLTYTIQFENLETATAAAQEVVVTDQLDGAMLDLTTFSLGPMGFGDVAIQLPSGVRTFSGGVDLRPVENLFVAIHAGIDDATGIVTWRFTTLDPETLAVPEDPLAGFLPPNVAAPEGQGSLTFTIQAKSGLATGASICNGAEIVFDANEPIVTPEWCNTVDTTPPSSTITALAATQASPSFLVSWSGTDAPAGIATYSVFVSENRGPFTAFVTDTTDTSATFMGAVGKSYGFYSVARDVVGNVEVAPASADATTIVSGPDAHDLAVTKLVVPRKVGLTAKAPAKTATVKVELHNRSVHAETIPNLATLAQLVTLEGTSLGTCPAPQPVLAQKKKLPTVIKSKGKLPVVFAVTFDCANDPAKTTAKDPDHDDYTWSASVNHAALDGNADTHPADDVCPRSVTPPAEVDPNPNGKIKDKGCGGKKPDKTFGAPVVVDVTVKP